MADGTVGVKQSTSPDRLVDNEVLSIGGQDVYRQRVQDPESIVLLDAVKTSMGTDGTSPPVVLGTGTGVRGWLRSIYEKLTGTIAVSGPVTDAQLRAADVKVTLDGEAVALDSTTLAALETIGLDSATLAALETITANPASSVINAGNSSTATLTANSSFTGAYVDVLGYAQQSVTLFVRPNVLISGDASDAKGSLFVDLSDTGTGAAPVQIPYVVRSPGLFIPQVPITVKQYMRVRYVNDGGASAITALGLTETAGTPTNQTEFALKTLLQPFSTKELLRTLDQGLGGSDPATLTLAVSAAQQPDGDFVKGRASGLARDVSGVSVRTTAALGSAGVYTSGWVNSDGWESVELTIAAVVVSASDGILVEFTDNPSSPTVRASVRRTFSTIEAAAGSATFRFAPRLNGFRVTYTNGGTAQAAFFLETHLHAGAVELPQSPLSSAVTGAQLGVLTRGGVLAPNAAGTWGTVERGTSGGFDIGIVQHEVETPIKSLTSFKVTRVSVTTTAALVFTPDANCRSWTAKAINSAGRVVYVGESAGVATSGSGFPLQNAEWVGGDLSSGLLYASCDSGTQALAIFEVIL